jgi:hypothetical protein
MKSINCSKPGYASITCSKIENIPYNLIFTTKFSDSSIFITIISCDYLNLLLANGNVGDVTIPTQVIKYNQNFLQVDQPIILQYSNQIKLYKYILGPVVATFCMISCLSTSHLDMFCEKNESKTCKKTEVLIREHPCYIYP